MPIIFDVDNAIFLWQATHHKKLTYVELAKRAGITLAALQRIKSGEVIHPDLRKINAICKALECEPGDLFKRVNTTGSLEEAAELNERRQQLLHELSKISIPDEDKTKPQFLITDDISQAKRASELSELQTKLAIIGLVVAIIACVTAIAIPIISPEIRIFLNLETRIPDYTTTPTITVSPTPLASATATYNRPTMPATWTPTSTIISSDTIGVSVSPTP